MVIIMTARMMKMNELKIGETCPLCNGNIEIADKPVACDWNVSGDTCTFRIVKDMYLCFGCKKAFPKQFIKGGLRQDSQ